MAIGLGVLGLAGIVGGSSLGWFGPSPADSPGRLSEAEFAAYQAGDRVNEALRWLERRADAAADELSRLIEDNRPDRLLAEAADRVASRLGGFVYRPGDRGEAWERLGADTRLEPGSTVLLVHGLDEPGDIWDELAPALSQAGHRVLRFNYANDQAPAVSADQLAAFLEHRAADAGIDELAIVGHSMGGLVSRDVLTRHAAGAEWQGPRVTHLITVGTPNDGSPVAALQPVGEAREVVARVWAARSLDPTEMLSFLVDGSGEAASALAQGSSYLTELNSRSLPADVAFTIIAAEASAAQRDALDELASSAPVAGLLSEKGREALLEQVDRMTDFIGDGVVPVASTPLEGVDDYTIVAANHRSMLRTIPLLSTDPVPPAIPLILDRLEPRLDPSGAPAGSGGTPGEPESER
jgi:triacylglycerol esterase/lipase EstA (alpha/beta hydrolase family)